jgi:hypothetical protein
VKCSARVRRLNGRNERSPTSVRKPEEQCDIEENIYIQIIRTVVCEATDINLGNNRL